MALWEYLFLFLAVVVGGSCGFVLQRLARGGWLPPALSFSGGYILGIAVLHLLPGVFVGGAPGPGLWLLAGFFVQLLLERLSGGLEHGHLHASRPFAPAFIVPLLFGLSVHAFVEGMPLSYYQTIDQPVAGHAHDDGHNHYLYAIILHHIPAAFALVTVLLLSGLARRWTWCCLVLFASMSPLGAALGESLDMSTAWQRGILAFAVGSLLHIATVILFETDGSRHHHMAPRKLAAIAAGLGLAALGVL